MRSMTSADSEAVAKQSAIIRAMAPERRLAQAVEMRQTMRALMTAGFRQRHPEWTDGQIREAVLQRIMYARTG